MSQLPNSNKQMNPNGGKRRPGFNLSWLYLAIILGLGYML